MWRKHGYYSGLFTLSLLYSTIGKSKPFFETQIKPSGTLHKCLKKKKNPKLFFFLDLLSPLLLSSLYLYPISTLMYHAFTWSIQPFDIVTRHCHLLVRVFEQYSSITKEKSQGEKGSHNLGWDVVQLIE